MTRPPESSILTEPASADLKTVGHAPCRATNPATPEASGEDHLQFWESVPAESRPGYFVYVIRAEGDSPIKVGWTVDVRKRLAQLQTGNPRRLELLHLLVGDHRLEHNLHRRLGQHSRMIGEWFDGEEVPPILALVADLARRMVAEFKETAEQPRWWDLMPDWRLHSGAQTRPSGHIKVRRVEPSPVSQDEQRTRRERTRRYW